MITLETNASLYARIRDEQKLKIARDLAGKTTGEIIDYVKEEVRKQKEVADAFTLAPDDIARVKLSNSDPEGTIAWAYSDVSNWAAFKKYMSLHLKSDLPSPPWLSDDEKLEEENVFQRLKDLLLLNLLSDMPEPKNKPGRPTSTDKRNDQVRYWVDMLSEVEGLKKGTNEANQGDPDTVVAIVGQAFGLSDSTVRDLRKTQKRG